MTTLKEFLKDFKVKHIYYRVEVLSEGKSLLVSPSPITVASFKCVFESWSSVAYGDLVIPYDLEVVRYLSPSKLNPAKGIKTAVFQLGPHCTIQIRPTEVLNG